ncbi:MAG: hypothetical protein ACRDPY_48235 [Streptosporangiaceae bacterium]
MTVLVTHDRGCRWARPGAEAEIDARGHVTGMRHPGGGHSDAAKRFAGIYGLHKAAGTTAGWIAVSYRDGSGGLTVYDTRAQAVRDCWPWEDRFFYCSLAERAMTICAAESVLRFRRVMAGMEKPDRDRPGGGLEVIPRLAAEDQEAQIRAARTGRGALALGRRK